MDRDEARAPGPDADSLLLLQRLARTARTLAAAGSVDETLQRLVEVCIELLPCDAASVMLVAGDRLHTPAATSGLARSLDRSQQEHGEGPCISALAEHPTVVVDDIRTEARWPRWRAGIEESGVRSMVGLRLVAEQDLLGALNLYAARVGAFDDRSVAVADVLASHGAVAMKTAITEEGLERAIASRDLIGRAKGILMAGDRLTDAAAFERLRDVANAHERRLVDVAREVCDTGELPSD